MTTHKNPNSTANNIPQDDYANCPMPHRADAIITLAHGGGGQLSQQLLSEIIKPQFGQSLQSHTDSAYLPCPTAQLAFTTDSYVIRPQFFPGGHIGELAVIGTANDLAMAGAEIKYLSCSLIIEEGYDTQQLAEILADMNKCATAMDAQFVTGDTKVVEHGKGDGLFINTAGIGFMPQAAPAPHNINIGDAIIISGDIGRHGACIMALRDNIQIEGLASDLAWLGPQINALQQANIPLHCLRDLTRGGLISALSECAQSAGLSFCLQGDTIPVGDAVQSLCELTGIDPLHLANEGRFVLFCPASYTDAVLNILRDDEHSQAACVIGEVTERGPHDVIQKTVYGTSRILIPPLGDQFPRIC